MEVGIARQPILNAAGKVVAYELLYRRLNPSMNEVDWDLATIDVLTNALVHIGLERVSNQKKTFVNFTEGLLRSDLINQLDPEQFVIEILETIEIDSHILSLLKLWKQRGFMLALDDFEFDLIRKFGSELFDLIDFIKVDVTAMDDVHQQVLLKVVSSNYPHIRMLAEKVETHEVHALCDRRGYHFYQGYYYAKPLLLTGKALPVRMTSILRVVRLLQDEASLEAITAAIEQQVQLSYQLLRLINSPGIGVRNEVSSIKHALILLGYKEVKRWIHILMLREMREASHLMWSEEITQSALFRAKCCELLAIETGSFDESSSFLIGILSQLDVLLDMPMEDILRELPLNESIHQALTGQGNSLRAMLDFAIAAERGKWDDLTVYAKEFDIDTSIIEYILRASLSWVEVHRRIDEFEPA